MMLLPATWSAVQVLVTLRSAEVTTGVVTLAVAVAADPPGPGVVLETVAEATMEPVSLEFTFSTNCRGSLKHEGNAVVEVHVSVLPDCVHPTPGTL
jgi:hypothetical protein